MKTTHIKYASAILLAGASLFIQSCTKSSDDTNAAGTGTVNFQVTDAPSDDASVKGAFVTIADMKVDGTSITGFSKQTVELKALQEGNVKLLGTTSLTAKDYNNLTLVIDTDVDANGASPGAYVQTIDDTKYKLSTTGGQINIVLNNSWTVTKNVTSTVILDFDLRKAIKSVADATKYSFVSNDNLQASIRLVSQDKVGTINGSYSEQVSPNADKVYVYAYKKGTFDSGIETQPQGDDALLFKNAITSAEVKGSLNAKTFKLAFIESGDYELHFASYNKDANDHFILQSLLQSTTTATGSAANIVTVQAGITVSVSSMITGI